MIKHNEVTTQHNGNTQIKQTKRTTYTNNNNETSKNETTHK